MTDNAPAGSSPAAGGATPPQTPPAPPAGTPPPATGGSSTDYPDGLGDAGKRAIDRMKAERQEALDRAKAAEARATELERAQMTAGEKQAARLADLERERTEWERERQDFRVGSAVERAATKAGFFDPADAMARIDRASLEYEKDGTPKNVERLVADLAKASPHLVRPAGTTGGFDTGTGGRPTGKPTYTRAQLRDTAFVAKLPPGELFAAAREGRIET